MESNYSANNSSITNTNVNLQEAKPPNSQELAKFIFGLEKQIKDEQAAELAARQTRQNQPSKDRLINNQSNTPNTQSNLLNSRTPSSYD